MTTKEPLAARLRARLPENLSHRAIALIVTIAIELLILLVLLSLGMGISEPASKGSVLSTFDTAAPVDEPAEDDSETATPEPAPTSRPVQTNQPVTPSPLTPPAIVLPRESAVPIPPPAPQPQPSPVPSPQPTAAPTSSIRAVIRDDGPAGPANTGRRGTPDSQVVGTAPDGSPLYAAQWYREPYPNELSGYLSAVRPPGWGLIACKTAPQWRVEDCQVVGESPQNSRIGQAVLAASWQFLVRPPRIDGEYQVGSWVRIRIDYSVVTGRR